MNIVEHRGEEVLENAVLLENFDGLGAGLEDVGDGHRGNGQLQPKIYIVFSGKKICKKFFNHSKFATPILVLSTWCVLNR